MFNYFAAMAMGRKQRSVSYSGAAHRSDMDSCKHKIPHSMIIYTLVMDLTGLNDVPY